MPGRESSARSVRLPSIDPRPFAFLSVAVVMACLFPGLSAQAQVMLPEPPELTFVSGRSNPVILPEATSGTPPYTYSVGEPPPGMSFDPDTRELSGTLPGPEGWGDVMTQSGRGGSTLATRSFSYTVTDSSAPIETASANIVYNMFEFPPGFLPAPAPRNVTFTRGRSYIVPLPRTADDSDPDPYTYAMTNLPPWLTFDPVLHELYTNELFNNMTETGTTTVTYSATHNTFTPTVTHTVTFDITVPELALPSQSPLTFVSGKPSSVTLPEATGGTPPYTYSLRRSGNRPLDLGLSFDPDTRVLSANAPDSDLWGGFDTDPGNVRRAQGSMDYTVTDAIGATVPLRIDFTILDFPPEFLPGRGDLNFTPGTAIDPVFFQPTLDEAPYNYALTGLPPGLTFDPGTRVLSGTPTRAGTATVTYTATHRSITPTLTHTVDFTITVAALALPAQDSLVYPAGTAVDLPLPAATGGTPSYTYALTGPDDEEVSAAVPGLTFDPARHVLSGTPTRAGTTTLRYTATDTRTSVTRTFDVTVTGPRFTAEVDDEVYPPDEAIRPLTLPTATGAGTVTYALAGPNGVEVSAAVPGLSFNPATRILSGTPTEEGETTLTYTATDGYGNATPITFDVLVSKLIPASEVTDWIYPVDEAIAPLTLPVVTGGTPPYTYTLTGPNGVEVSAAVPGLTFDPDTRVLSGTPTTGGTTTLTYTVTDSADTPASVKLLFDVTVTERLSVAEVEDQTYGAGEAIAPLTLPVVTGGTPPYTYALTGPNGVEVSAAVPGLTFDPATRILSGTPTRAGTTTLTYTATDEYGNATRANFDVTVTGPRFDEEVEDRTYAVDEAIVPQTLPAATGAGTVTYALSGPDGVDVGAAVPGLSFDPGTRVLSGTPTEEGETTLTYTATDGYGNDTPLTFVVTVTGVIPAALNEILLPEVVRAMADSTVGAIARRMGQAARGSAGSAAAGLSLGGQGGLAAALRTHGEAVSEGRRDFRELLSGSNFVLNAAGASGASPVTLWGSGEYRGLSGRSGTLDWDGELAGVHLGVDARLRPDLLAGVAVSRLESGLDYEDAVAAGDGGLGAGAHEVELTGVHPYLWSAWKGLEVWATAGYGEGELGVTPTGRERRSSEVETRTVGVGGSGLLLERGVSTVRLKGEVMHSVLGVDDSTYIEGLEVEAIRVRMTVAAGQSRVLAGGGVMEPSLEVGVRHDGGDGETGSGAEVGGGLSYRHPAWRITAGGRVRALVGHGGDHEEWGIEGHLGVSPGAGGQGLSLSLRPGYGDSGGGIRELWRQGVTGAGDRGAGDYRGRLEARLGYGLFLPGYAGVFTPYTGMTLGATDGYRIGVNWKAGARFDLDLLGERRKPGGGPAEHALLLKGQVRF